MINWFIVQNSGPGPEPGLGTGPGTNENTDLTRTRTRTRCEPILCVIQNPHRCITPCAPAGRLIVLKIKVCSEFVAAAADWLDLTNQRRVLESVQSVCAKQVSSRSGPEPDRKASSVRGTTWFSLQQSSSQFLAPLGPSGPLWTPLGPSGPFRALLGPLGLLWALQGFPTSTVILVNRSCLSTLTTL